MSEAPATCAALTIIIPSYEDGALVRANVPGVVDSVRGHAKSCTVLIVDDGSRVDPAPDFPDCPSVQLVRHTENRGFAQAIMTGVRAATTELLLLLNSDVRPERGFLPPLIGPLTGRNVFATSPLILNEDGTANRYSWNRYEYRAGRLHALSWSLGDESLRSTTLPTLFTSGGSMAVKRSMFLELDGFADLYAPFYVEDLDLGVRAWRRGWKSLFVPRSRVTHQEQGSIRRNVAADRVRRIQRRNRFLFEWSHVTTGRLIFPCGPAYLRQLTGRLARGDRVYPSALIAALRRLPSVKRHRRRIAAASIHSFEDVLARVNRLSRSA